MAYLETNNSLCVLPKKNNCDEYTLINFQGFKKGFDEVIQKYILSKNTPVKPSKKKAKGRIEKLDSHGKL